MYRVCHQLTVCVCHPLANEVETRRLNPRDRRVSNPGAMAYTSYRTSKMSYLFSNLQLIPGRCARAGPGAGCGILPVSPACGSLTHRMRLPRGLVLTDRKSVV